MRLKVDDKRGFLLFEVIVSIVLITAGLLFVMRGYSTSKEAIYRSRDLFEVSLLLEEKIFKFEEKGEIEEGTKEIEFVDNKNYSWNVSANKIEGLNLNLVTLNVFPKETKETPEGTKYSLAAYLKNKPR